MANVVRSAWLDVFFLGVVLVVFGIWFTDARPTEKVGNKAFAVSGDAAALRVFPTPRAVESVSMIRG